MADFPDPMWGDALLEDIEKLRQELLNGAHHEETMSHFYRESEQREAGKRDGKAAAYLEVAEALDQIMNKYCE